MGELLRKPDPVKAHKFVDHNLVYFLKKPYICHVNQLSMERTFIFGVSVSGDNFTDRIEETRRLIQNFISSETPFISGISRQKTG